MRLKRLYNHDAPAKEWVTRQEVCPTCKGKGKIVNAAADGLEKCPDCKDGAQSVKVPPVVGVEVLQAGPQQNFSPDLVFNGQKEGWITTQGEQLVLTGSNVVLTYRILRVPGKYDDGTINHYECKLIGEETV